MNLTKACYFFILAASLSSCEFNCSTGGNKSVVATKPVSSDDKSELNGAIIKNEIDVEASGVKISEVYLMDADNNYMDENVTRLNEKIYLVIKADTGWVKENDLSFIGASERISTSSGRVIVDAADIFKDYETTGLPADKAHLINLSALITEVDPGIENFVVQFKVWDKKGKGEVKGKYKFSIKK